MSKPPRRRPVQLSYKESRRQKIVISQFRRRERSSVHVEIALEDALLDRIGLLGLSGLGSLGGRDRHVGH